MSLVLALLSPAAHAHATALLEGLDVHDHALGGQVVEASFGVLWQDASDPTWRWICHEAVTQEGAVIAPRYAFGADGSILSAVPALEQSREIGLPVYRTDDRCAWTPADGLTDVPVIDVAMHPTDAGEALAIAADVAGGTGGSIHHSADGGRSFEEVLASDGRFFRSVVYAPDGGAWVAASWYDTPGAWALHSADGGRTWTEHTLPLPEVEPGTDIDADVLLADETGAWFAVGAFRHDTLLHVTPDGTATLVATPDVELTDLALGEDGTLWLAGNGDTYMRLDADGLAVLEAAPVGQGVQVVGDTLRLAMRSRIDGRQLVESTDGGATFSTSFHLSELQRPPTCPADSPVAIRCETLWPALEERLPLPEGEEPEDEPGGDDSGGPTGDAPAADGDAGAGKSADGCGGGGAAGLLALPLLLAGRRRR